MRVLNVVIILLCLSNVYVYTLEFYWTDSLMLFYVSKYIHRETDIYLHSFWFWSFCIGCSPAALHALIWRSFIGMH